MNLLKTFYVCTLAGFFLCSCNSPPKLSVASSIQAVTLGVAATSSPSPTPRSLYVVSGSCYAGGVPTANPTNQIKSFDTTTKKMAVVMDYNSYSAFDSPIGIASLDANNLIVSVEDITANTRRLDQVSKIGGATIPYLYSSLAFNSQLRHIFNSQDGGLLVTKATAVEKITSFRTRYLNSGNPYLSNPLTPACAAMNTALTFAFELPNGKVVIGSAAAAPNNKIALLNSNGYVTVADCLSARAAPTATALPVAGVSVSDDTFLIAYSSPNAADNQVVSYQYDKTTFNLTTATVVAQVSNSSQVFGVSAMVFDPKDNGVYIASSPAGAEKIEKYFWDPKARVLNRAGSTPFLQNVTIPCISGLFVN